MRQIELPATNSELKAEYESGATLNDLAVKYNTGISLISNRLDKAHCTRRKSSDTNKLRPPAPLIDIKTEYSNGSSLLSLADKYAVSYTVMRRWLVEAGANIRDHATVCKKQLPVSITCLKMEYDNGATKKQLAKKYSISPWGITARLTEAEYAPRTQSEVSKNYPLPNGPTRRNMSAAQQGVSISDWKGYANEKRYCTKFNASLRELIRVKYGRRCFLCGKTEAENSDRKLSVHHVDRNKDQGCNEVDWRLVPLCGHCHSSGHNTTDEARMNYLLNNVWGVTKTFIYNDI